MDGVFRPMKLLRLLTELSGIGLCGTAGGAVVEATIVLADLLNGRLGVDWVGWMDEVGVDVPAYTELRVEDDFVVGIEPLEPSELLWFGSQQKLCLDRFWDIRRARRA